MHVLRFTRLVLLSALCLAVLLVVAPSVQARSLTSAQPLTCPRITGFTPQSGPPGTSVTLTGCGFTGTTSVAFHGVVASFTVNSDTQITTSVPTGALSGPITVTTSSITVKSPGKFLVPPTLTLSSTVGPPTTPVTVSGTNFGHFEGVDVYFDTTDEALTSTTVQGQFSISIQVPAGAVPGTHWITAVGRHSGLSAQASFLVQTDWTAFRNLPTHIGINPYENVLSPTNVGKLDSSWSATNGTYISSSAVANGVVYANSSDDNLYAYNVQTGVQLWSSPTSTYVASPPAVTNGVVYIGSGYDLLAYNGQTGTQLWSAPTGNNVSSPPTVASGAVYVGSWDNHLYAFNAQTGAQLWSAPTISSISSSPAVANGVVYVGSFDGHLYAFNAQTGAQLWSAATGSFIESSPAVANGVVYIDSDDGYLYAFNAQTGGQLWSTLTGGSISSSPAVANGMVYVSSNDFHLYAYALPPGDQLKPPARPNPAGLKPNLKLLVRP